MKKNFLLFNIFTFLLLTSLSNVHGFMDSDEEEEPAPSTRKSSVSCAREEDADRTTSSSHHDESVRQDADNLEKLTQQFEQLEEQYAESSALSCEEQLKHLQTYVHQIMQLDSQADTQLRKTKQMLEQLKKKHKDTESARQDKKWEILNAASKNVKVAEAFKSKTNALYQEWLEELKQKRKAAKKPEKNSHNSPKKPFFLKRWGIRFVQFCWELWHKILH